MDKVLCPKCGGSRCFTIDDLPPDMNSFVMMYHCVECGDVFSDNTSYDDEAIDAD